jgi:flagellar export protein FliJ
MKAFQFRLQNLLEFRQARFEAEQEKLGRMESEVADLAARAAEIQQELFNVSNEPASRGTVTGRDLQVMIMCRTALQNELKRATTALDAARRQAERQRAVVIKAGQEHRALELLKEKQWSEWNYEFNRELEEFAAEAHLSARNRAKAAE